eukprot:jgi/Chrzof1/14355/UNPLg00629.t1
MPKDITRGSSEPSGTTQTLLWVIRLLMCNLDDHDLCTIYIPHTITVSCSCTAMGAFKARHCINSVRLFD